jgi:hypothetical protein
MMQSKQYLTGTELRVAPISKELHNEIGEVWVRAYWAEITHRPILWSGRNVRQK